MTAPSYDPPIFGILICRPVVGRSNTAAHSCQPLAGNKEALAYSCHN